MPKLPFICPEDLRVALSGFNVKKNNSQTLMCVGSMAAGRVAFMQLIAQHFLCDSSSAMPCDQCQNCRLLNTHQHPDILWLNIDDLPVKIDQVRHLVHFLQKTPTLSQRRIAGIFSADKLSVQCANALLKTLEAPLGNAVLLIGANHPSHVLETISSRCRVIQMPSVDQALAKSWLQNETNVSSLQAASWLNIANNEPLNAMAMIQDKEMSDIIHHLMSDSFRSTVEWGLILKEVQQVNVALDMVLSLVYDANITLATGRLSCWAELYPFWAMCLKRFSFEKLSHAWLSLMVLKRILKQSVSLHVPTLSGQLAKIWNTLVFDGVNRVY